MALPGGKSFILENYINTNRNGIAASAMRGDSSFWLEARNNVIINRLKNNNVGLGVLDKEKYGESDHPDVDELYNRVSKIDPKISIATVYRTVKILEEAGILIKHDFKAGKARYEQIRESHHDHLIDVKTGEIIEFVDDEIELLQKKVAEKFGYKLVDHKLELYGIKKKPE